MKRCFLIASIGMLWILISWFIMINPLAAEQNMSVASMPPVVVSTIPQAGDTAVDPSLTEIRVTFSKDMNLNNWAWVRLSEESFPELVGKPRFLDDRRTCVLTVKLQPDQTYVLWINTDKYAGFKDLEQRPAVPYLLVFETTAAKS